MCYLLCCLVHKVPYRIVSILSCHFYNLSDFKKFQTTSDRWQRFIYFDNLIIRNRIVKYLFHYRGSTVVQFSSISLTVTKNKVYFRSITGKVVRYQIGPQLTILYVFLLFKYVLKELISIPTKNKYVDTNFNNFF